MLNYETDSNEQYTINIPKCFFFIILRKMIDLKLRIFGQILHRAKSIPDKIKIKIRNVTLLFETTPLPKLIYLLINDEIQPILSKRINAWIFFL